MTYKRDVQDVDNAATGHAPHEPSEARSNGSQRSELPVDGAWEEKKHQPCDATPPRAPLARTVGEAEVWHAPVLTLYAIRMSSIESVLEATREAVVSRTRL